MICKYTGRQIVSPLDAPLVIEEGDRHLVECVEKTADSVRMEYGLSESEYSFLLSGGEVDDRLTNHRFSSHDDGITTD